MALDSASNGNFNTRSPAEACVLIENLASSNSTKNADFERQKNAGAMDGKQIAELKNKLDSVHNILVNKKTVHFAQEVETFEPEEASDEQDCNYIGGNGFQSQRFGNQQARGNFNGYGQKSSFAGNQNSFQKPLQSTNNFSRNYGSSSYQTPPAQTEQSEMKAMLEQILEGQQKITVDLNGKIDAVYTDLNNKFEALNSHVKKLDTQVQQLAGSVMRLEKTPLGRTDTNSKYQCSAVLEQERIEAELGHADRVSIDTHHQCRSTPMVNRSSNETSVDRHPRLVSIATQTPASWLRKETSVDRHHTPSVDRHQPSPKAEQTSKSPSIIEERVYKPKPPYPRAPKVYSTVTQDRIPEKLKDPGSFVLDCSISQNRFKSSLCDLGSCVSLMPYSVALTLGMTDFTPTKISLILADRSTRIPEGILEDVPVKIGDCIIPTDFVILKYSEEPKDPLILGRPFLATAGALIDVKHGQITLNVGDLKMSFDMDKLEKRPSIDGQTFSVDTQTNLTEEIFHEMHHTDPLERALISSTQKVEHLDDSTAGSVKMMDAGESMTQLVSREKPVPKSSSTAKSIGWSEKAPKVKLKQPPTGLRIILENGTRSAVYHQRTNANLKKRLISRDFEPSDQVPLYQSCLQLSPEKLRSLCLGPCTTKEGEEFTMHGKSVKHYWAKAKIPDGDTVRLDDAPSPKTSAKSS